MTFKCGNKKLPCPEAFQHWYYCYIFGVIDMANILYIHTYILCIWAKNWLFVAAIFALFCKFLCRLKFYSWREEGSNFINFVMQTHAMTLLFYILLHFSIALFPFNLHFYSVMMVVCCVHHYYLHRNRCCLFFPCVFDDEMTILKIDVSIAVGYATGSHVNRVSLLKVNDDFVLDLSFIVLYIHCKR